MANGEYLVDAAKQIRMALDREVNEDYEAAFSYYKNGVDLLLNGVQGNIWSGDMLTPMLNFFGYLMLQMAVLSKRLICKMYYLFIGFTESYGIFSNLAVL